MATKKDDNIESLVQFKLKYKFSLDPHSSCYSGSDISCVDLGKKNRSSKQIISGRQLLDMVLKGVMQYRKALDLACHKWDLKLNKVKKSGDTIEDII